MPALFLAEAIPAETCLVDTTATGTVKERTRKLNLVWGPVFYGRGEFITAMDRLLDDEDPLNVLVAHTPDPDQSYGGTRLLRELAARAVQVGPAAGAARPLREGPADRPPRVRQPAQPQPDHHAQAAWHCRRTGTEERRRERGRPRRHRRGPRGRDPP